MMENMEMNKSDAVMIAQEVEALASQIINVMDSPGQVDYAQMNMNNKLLLEEGLEFLMKTKEQYKNSFKKFKELLKKNDFYTTLSTYGTITSILSLYNNYGQ